SLPAIFSGVSQMAPADPTSFQRPPLAHPKHTPFRKLTSRVRGSVANDDKNFTSGQQKILWRVQWVGGMLGAPLSPAGSGPGQPTCSRTQVLAKWLRPDHCA